MGTASFRNYLRLLTFIRPYLGRLVAASAAMVCLAGITASPIPIIKEVMDQVFAERNGALAWKLSGLVVLIFLFKGIVAYLQDYLMGSIGHRVIRDIRNGLYAKLQDLSVDYFTQEKTGQIMSRFTADIPVVRPAITDVPSRIIRDGLTVVFCIALVFYYNWKMAVAALVIFPPVLWIIFGFAKRLTRKSELSLGSIGELTSLLQETIANMRIVKAFGAERREQQRFEKENERFTDINLGYTRITSRSTPLSEFVGALGFSFFVGFGGAQVARGEVTQGAFFAFIAALWTLYRPLKGISELNTVLPMGLAASERIFSILDAPSSVREPRDPVVLPALAQGIEFDGVGFAYAEGRPVLKDIRLSIRRGEVVALVGPSGAGKTTLVDLLPRFYDPTAGAIRIDGRDIRDATLRSLRGMMGIVTQETILFNDSVRANIAYGRPDADLEAVQAAARTAYAHDFIQRLPQGYDTQIGERGVKLSGGERQRLAIARAILRDPAILIFDEATSALDTESEQWVQKAIEAVMQRRTTLVIAHRLSTIQRADRIVVLERGEIVESGKHGELSARNGLYKKLYDMQFNL